MLFFKTENKRLYLHGGSILHVPPGGRKKKKPTVVLAPLGGDSERTRRPERAQHGLQQLRLRPRPQPPGEDYQRHEEGGLLPEDAELSAEIGAAPRVALLPAGRFVVP
jgi:hypothetical protein